MKAKIKREQLSNEFYDNFNKLLVVNGQNLKSFCEANKLDYHKTRARLKSKWIELDWYHSLCELAEEKSFNYRLSITYTNGWEDITSF